MGNVTVIGAQWGDEGKSKTVDWLASRADIVVRFQIKLESVFPCMEESQHEDAGPGQLIAQQVAADPDIP